MRKKAVKDDSLGIIGKLKNSEQTISLILGIVVVLLVGGLVFRYFRGRSVKVSVKKSSPPAGEVSKKAISSLENESTVLPAKYKVQKDDNLWKIANKFYHSGYNWVDIAKENKIHNPDILLVGMELSIPDVKVRQPQNSLAKKGNEGAINGGSYVVKKGDSLSKIALRAYGDMFAWQRIYEANKDKIKNPVLIYAGQRLVIPKQAQKSKQ